MGSGLNQEAKADAGKLQLTLVPKRTLKRWEKEVAAWHDENDGKETV